MIAPKVRNPRVLEVEDAVSIYAHCDVSNTVSTLHAYIGISNQNGYKSSRTNDLEVQYRMEKPVRVYKLRPCVIGACHWRQLPVRPFIVFVEKRGKRENGPWGNARKKERGTRTKRWALEWAVLQIAPPALEMVIGRTWARKPCTSSFTWHAPGPGSEAAFREENFYRVARIERKNESESSLLHV
ncbi:hypothetical protein ALC53_04061 [Atta colombica]|uniref:Uncharacterized protein n=1 Tax=Atta colombica TaxID=520822 RepID=A0A195BLN7_9HYME|nr:hypothetical protein ALC53_04061 [Atta colombica]